MRKAAMLVLFALLAVAMVFAQNAGNANSSSSYPQTQNSNTNNPSTTNPDQNATTSRSSTGQNSSVSGSQNTQSTTTTDPNAQNNNTQAQPSYNQSTVPNNNTPNNTQTANPSGVQTNNDNSGFGNRPSSSGPGDLAAGTEIRATLDTPLSSKTSKSGDRFTATVNQPVQGNGGNVVIPAGSRIEGEVSESEQGKTLPALRGKGKLNLRFRDVVLPNGQTVPVTGTLVSVHSTNGKDNKSADNEGQVESGTRGRDVAKDVGIGAGVGTVAGLIFGGPLKGLAIGALAGGGYVLATNGKDVNLPAQTGLVLRLDQPLNLSNR